MSKCLVCVSGFAPFPNPKVCHLTACHLMSLKRSMLRFDSTNPSKLRQITVINIKYLLISFVVSYCWLGHFSSRNDKLQMKDKRSSNNRNDLIKWLQRFFPDGIFCVLAIYTKTLYLPAFNDIPTLIVINEQKLSQLLSAPEVIFYISLNKLRLIRNSFCASTSSSTTAFQYCFNFRIE